MATTRLISALCVCFAILVPHGAFAGSISFQLSLTGPTLTLTSRGDSSAYYPGVLRLRPDGRWEALAAAPGAAPPAELAPGSHAEFIYPEISDPQTSLGYFQPMMVRFYDSAGVGFGQISFFRPPPLSREMLQTRYSGGELVISPPEAAGSIRASWLLWPQEDGIARIRGPQEFGIEQPPALRFDWRPGMAPPRIDTGAGQPAAMLLHETASGHFLQTIPRGSQTNGHRSAWLNESRTFYGFALVLAGVAALAALFHFLRGMRTMNPRRAGAPKDHG